MKRTIGSAAILASVGLAACGDSRYMLVGLEPHSRLGIPGFQQVDDSVRLYASEWKQRLLGDGAPSMPASDEAPDRYEWSSSNPMVADVKASGWMFTHAAGQVVITVRGAGSSYSQAVSVCSRETRLRIDPRDPVIRLHDTIAVGVALTQPHGEACGEIDFGPFAPQLGGTQALEPIFTLPHHWRAIRTGTYWYTSYFPFAQRILRDSILVTVK